ncbi:MAG: cell division protein ZapE [Oceanospirillaceae bacterium]|nr:cell division protein ZapE [Oceanospirillaceae bacterium]
MSTPLQIYQKNIQDKGYRQDDAQLEAIEVLQQLFVDLKKGQITAHSSVYLWGRVGRGKTYLMDCFYDACLSNALGSQVKRIHYYRFMQYLHRQLKVHQGKKDPLVYVAKDLLKQYKILCLDEFFVSDIADAMLLGRLMKVLFEQGLVLIATSNVEPTQLYKDGLQRDRFLPAIATLEHYLQVLHMSGAEDHRLAKASGFPNYYIEAIEADAKPGLNEQQPVFHRFIADSGSATVQRDVDLTIESRVIKCLAVSERLYCFSFEQLFVGPRSANDYIALSKIADCVYLLSVPQMGGALNERKVARGTEDTYNINQKVADRPFVLAQGDDEARRFISFIDELYDQQRQVVISAAVELSQLYLGGRVVFEFERTVSRIIEMQGDEYAEN